MQHPCESLTELLGRSIQENPPLSIKDGDIIKDGYNDKLDQYRYVSKTGKRGLLSLKRERDITGIKSLKIGYNRIFGYYIEVTKANLAHFQKVAMSVNRRLLMLNVSLQMN